MTWGVWIGLYVVPALFLVLWLFYCVYFTSSLGYTMAMFMLPAAAVFMSVAGIRLPYLAGGWLRFRIDNQTHVSINATVAEAIPGWGEAGASCALTSYYLDQGLDLMVLGQTDDGSYLLRVGGPYLSPWHPPCDARKLFVSPEALAKLRTALATAKPKDDPATTPERQ